MADSFAEQSDSPEDSRKGPVRARRRAIELPEYLPARMLNEFTYCPRLFFYEWVEGVFAHSADTIEGALRHEKLETKEDALPPPANPSESPLGKERTKEGSTAEPEPGDVIRARSVELASETYKVIAKIDLVEATAGVVSPIDYKKGRPCDGDDGPEPWPADRTQVAVQALILRDNGYRCDEAVLYYHATKQRVRVAIDDALVQATVQALHAARSLAESGRIPPPLVDSPKCPRCSLVGICLPDETAASMSLPARNPIEQLALFPFDGEDDRPLQPAGEHHGDVRRLVPARDDLRPLYVTGHGLTVGKSGDVLQIRDRQKLVQEARVNEISQVNVFGNITLTAAAVQGLCWAEKPIAHFSFGGWFYGLTAGLGLKNVFLRRDQFRRAEDANFGLRVAREIVATKVRNQRTLLQRNHIEPPAPVLQRLKRFADQAGRAGAMEELLGIEGSAARLYFEHFSGMLKVDGGAVDSLHAPTPIGAPGASRPSARGHIVTDGEPPPAFDFAHRNRRPPRDPVNALLSFAYSMLVKDLTIICHAIGFDPFIGFYHQPRFGRPALALDLMEGFRPLIADSAVLSAINTRMVTTDDFIAVGNAVSLTPAGRKGFIRAYEQRIDTLATHPLFGYRVSYRRILEIQARLLARVVTGELLRYPGFETR
ncbi:MAG TPA: CRISPR-associated endonuclease Cas1 [Candidatus Binatia bacterium]|nr:CRISPR-associated endonuclease Cas1 [Candidatus Binatia bacterium]